MGSLGIYKDGWLAVSSKYSILILHETIKTFKWNKLPLVIFNMELYNCLFLIFLFEILLITLVSSEWQLMSEEGITAGILLIYDFFKCRKNFNVFDRHAESRAAIMCILWIPSIFYRLRSWTGRKSPTPPLVVSFNLCILWINSRAVKIHANQYYTYPFEFWCEMNISNIVTAWRSLL